MRLIPSLMFVSRARHNAEPRRYVNFVSALILVRADVYSNIAAISKNRDDIITHRRIGWSPS